MSKSKTGALVKDQGSLLAESEGKVAGMTAKGIIKMSEYSVSRDPESEGKSADRYRSDARW